MPHTEVEALEPRQLLATVAVSLSSTAQTIRGMGANIAKFARNPGAPLSDTNTKFLLENLHPTHIRVPINLMAWEPKPDNNDANVTNWSAFKDTGRQHEQFIQIQDLAKRGVEMMASIFDGPDWLVLDPESQFHRTVDPEKYGMMAEGIATWLIRVRDTYGVKISNISINESNAGYNLRFPQSIFRPFLKIAGPMFEKMGLGYVKWVIGDDGYVSATSFVKPVLQDTSVQKYMGDVGWHTWNLDDFPDSYFFDLGKTVKSYGKELWATETGYAPLIHRDDPGAFARWDHARITAEIYLRSLTLLPITVMDYWQYGDDFPLVSPLKKPYPAYYIIKTYDENLAPGSQMVKAKSDDTDILSMAAKDQKNNKFFAQVINRETTSQTVNFTGLPNQAFTLTRSSATENSVVVGTYTPSGGKLTLKLPADSVSNLSGKLFSGAAGAPAPKISKPSTSTTYTSGGQISFSGSATDPQDGTLSSSKLSWKLELHHNGIVDDPVTFKGVSSGSFTVPQIRQRETSQFYRVILTATDSTGLASSTFVDVEPVIANITLKSNVPGLFVRLDGLAETTNAVVSEITGTHKLDAPTLQLLNGRQYLFSSWSDGGSRTHSITNSGDKTVTVNYVDVTGTSKAGTFLSPTADAYVADGPDADKNFGSATGLLVKSSADVGKNRLAYLTFDIAGISKSPGSAYLRLFGAASGSDTVDTSVFGVGNTGWSESGITYNDRPTPDSTAQSKNQIADTIQRWYSWDLTNYVAAAKNAGKTQVSLALSQPPGGSSSTFLSREGSNGPQLVISGSSSTTTPPTPPPLPPGPTTTLNAVADAYVQSGTNADANFGGSAQLLTKAGSVNVTRRSYVQFDLGSIGSISSARLRLNGWLSTPNATNLTAKLYDVSAQDWNESSITWNNKPGIGSSSIGSILVANTNPAFYEVDLTSYLKSKKAAGATQVTIAFSTSTASDPAIVFASRESANAPQLLIQS